MATDLHGYPQDYGWRPHKPETWTHRFADLKEHVTLTHWKGRNPDGSDIEETVDLPAGSRVKIVMVSRFGDVGITEKLDADNGYGKRVSLDDLCNYGEQPYATDLHAAAERLRVNVYDDSHDTADGYVSESREKDLWTIADAYLRETDSRPIDEAFARSVATRQHDLPWSNLIHWFVGEVMSIQRDSGGVFYLAFKNHRMIVNPTIGDFWTACRLFNVDEVR